MEFVLFSPDYGRCQTAPEQEGVAKSEIRPEKISLDCRV